MKRLTFVLVLILSVAMSYSQSILTEIEFSDGVPPTVIVIDEDMASIVKIAVATVKSRTKSHIVINSTIYLVEYNGGYKVSAFHIDDEDLPIDLNNFVSKEPYLFETTRVSDVRTFLKDELMAFYYSEHQ